MSMFVVHSVPGSPYGRAVLATLEEKGARYRLQALAPGMFRDEQHLSRHPFGKVPVLEHDGFQMYETQAILRYLDRVLPAPPLTPPDHHDAARMDQLMNICDCYLFQGVANVIAFERVVSPRLLGGVPNEAAIEACLPKAHTVFNEIARLLGGQSFLAGNAVSLADLMVAPQMDFMSLTPEWEVLTAAHGNLVGWLDRMNGRRSMRATTWELVAEMA